MREDQVFCEKGMYVGVKPWQCAPCGKMSAVEAALHRWCACMELGKKGRQDRERGARPDGGNQAPTDVA